MLRKAANSTKKEKRRRKAGTDSLWYSGKRTISYMHTSYSTFMSLLSTILLFNPFQPNTINAFATTIGLVPNASYSYSTLVKATKAFSRLLCFLKEKPNSFLRKISLDKSDKISICDRI